MARASVAVAVLSLLATLFVYLPLLVFTVGIVVVGVRLPATLTER